MENLNAVSETALLTLKARVIEAEKQSPVIHDAKGREILDKISSHVSTETQRRVLNRKLPSTLTSYLALRARKYDSYTKTFIKKMLFGSLRDSPSHFLNRRSYLR